MAVFAETQSGEEREERPGESREAAQPQPPALPLAVPRCGEEDSPASSGLRVLLEQKLTQREGAGGGG